MGVDHRGGQATTYRNSPMANRAKILIEGHTESMPTSQSTERSNMMSNGYRQKQVDKRRGNTEGGQQPTGKEQLQWRGKPTQRSQ